MAFIDKKTLKVYHEITVPIVEQRSFECDDLIAPIISVLNQKGYITNFCCSGHPYPHIEEMYIIIYDDTGEAISSTMGSFDPPKNFFKDLAAWRKISLSDIPEEHQFSESEIDVSRPFTVYYIETDKDIFSCIAYIGFIENYFNEEDIAEGWELFEVESYSYGKGYTVNNPPNIIIQFEFSPEQDAYDFFTQQINTFRNLLNWAKDLPDLTK